MLDSNELEALKASLRGVRRSADALGGLAARVEALDPGEKFAETDLDDLHRLSSAHALAAQALRGLVETMLTRHGKLPQEAATASTGEDE